MPQDLLGVFFWDVVISWIWTKTVQVQAWWKYWGFHELPVLHCCSGRSAASRVWWDHAQPAVLPVLLNFLIAVEGKEGVWSDLRVLVFQGEDKTGPSFLTVLPLLVGAPGQLFCSVVCSYLGHTSGGRKQKYSKASEQQRGECLQAGTKLTLLNRIWEASAACLNCLVQNKCFLWSKSKAEHTDLGCTLQISTLSQLPLCAGWAGLSVVTWLLKEAKIMLDEKI